VSAPTWKLAVKRVADVAASATLFLVLSPLFALIAVLVKVTSRGPVLFKHERVGRDGVTFRLWKFRTMAVGTHERIWGDEQRRAEFMANGFKLPAGSTEITKIGRLLRKTSLDELPQLWNVLRGDMSLVGVRPLVPIEVGDRSESDQQLYMAMRPGVTGLWQVEGRSMVPHDDRCGLDREYVATWGLANDTGILLRTPFAVLRTEQVA
jgi:lipopolysaccharide/colanic/teichoic acid biosynthesis glycosyltransferase